MSNIFQSNLLFFQNLTAKFVPPFIGLIFSIPVSAQTVVGPDGQEVPDISGGCLVATLRCVLTIPYTGFGSDNYIRITIPEKDGVKSNQTWTYLITAENETSSKWTDFHFQVYPAILPGERNPPVIFDNQGSNNNGIDPRVPVFTSGKSTNGQIDWQGGLVPVGGKVQFIFTFLTTSEFKGDLSIDSYATVPEPLTILGTSTAIVFGFAFKKKRNAIKK